MKKIWLYISLVCLISCSEKKKNTTTEEVSGKVVENTETSLKTTEKPVSLDFGNETNISEFLNNIQTDNNLLSEFEEKLKKGGFAEIELLQLKHGLSEFAVEQSSETGIDNKGNEVKNAAENLFKTVSKGTDKVLQRANPNTKKIEELINEQLALINQKTGYNANAVLDLGKEKLANFVGGDTKSILYEKMTKSSVYNAYGQNKALEAIAKTQNQDSISQYITEYLKISENEVELLQKIPSFVRYINEEHAKENKAVILDKEVENYLKSGKASAEFVKITGRHVKLINNHQKSILNKSKKARNEFQRLNPNWTGNSEILGNTYFDEKGNAVYLPLGKASFADRVVSHNVGNPKGGFSKGALGEPDVIKDEGKYNPNMCNVGTKGVLVLEFIDNALTDVNGPDLYVFEIGEMEPTQLEISKDGSNWINIGKIEGGTAAVDIHEFVRPNETFTFIKLTDLMTESLLPGADIDAVATIGGIVRLQLDSSVLFEFGKYNLKPEAEELLKNLLPQIENFEKGTIVIEGHTDNVGSASSNKKLSEQRAESVSNLLKILMKENAKNFKWETKGLGDTQPVAPNNSDENRQKNRRVEILILPD